MARRDARLKERTFFNNQSQDEERGATAVQGDGKVDTGMPALHFIARTLSWPLPTVQLPEYVDEDDEFPKHANTSLRNHHESCPEQLPLKSFASDNDLSTPTDLGSTEAHLPINSFGSTATDHDAMHPPGYAGTVSMALLAWHCPILGHVPLHINGGFSRVGPSVEGGGNLLQEAAEDDQL